jgi:hypothetical protein
MDWFLNIIRIIQAISIFIGILVAIYGIDSWRREHLFKRRSELAEDTLALFYEAEDAIKHMRSPFSFASETEDLEREEGESEWKFKARQQASVVFYRYKQYQQLFSKIHASRYRFMAQIGKKEAEPFNEIRIIVNEIIHSARTLSRLWANQYLQDTVYDSRDTARRSRETARQERDQKKVEKYEAVLWDDNAEDDPINPRINKVIKDIEKTCSSIISGKYYSFVDKLKNLKLINT